MKFIHAVVFDKDDFNHGGYDITNWDELTSGDYTVHCLYSIDNQEILIQDDNVHAPVETMIENFLEGVEFCGHDAIVTNAYIVVDNGLAYRADAVGLCLVEGNYGEVM